MFMIMNSELRKLYVWLVANKLSINLSKTHYVLFRPGRLEPTICPELLLNGSPLERKYSTTFLGVIIDSKLSWGEHISHIKSKIAKNIGIISRARHALNDTTMKTLYYAFIHPYLTYCLEIWGAATNSRLQSIYRLQKLSCRIISHSPPRTPTLALLRSMRLLSLHQLYELSIMLYV